MGKENRINHDLESYIMRCARQYEQKNPDKKVHLRKMVEIPTNECEYCDRGQEIYQIPFSLTAHIHRGELIIGDGDTYLGKSIKYCPMCGRNLEV